MGLIYKVQICTEPICLGQIYCGVNLIGADLSGADLSGADMTGAKIKVGTKIMVRLMGANLAGTIMPDGQVHI
jgi:uncharacterized protein YjbI with pentapeptide repeats